MSGNKEKFRPRIIEFYGKKLKLYDLDIKAYSKHRPLKKINLFSSIEEDINNMNNICKNLFWTIISKVTTII